MCEAHAEAHEGSPHIWPNAMTVVSFGVKCERAQLDTLVKRSFLLCFAAEAAVCWEKPGKVAQNVSRWGSGAPFSNQLISVPASQWIKLTPRCATHHTHSNEQQHPTPTSEHMPRNTYQHHVILPSTCILHPFKSDAGHPNAAQLEKIPVETKTKKRCDASRHHVVRMYTHVYASNAVGAATQTHA